jgi:hypothetical protein
VDVDRSPVALDVLPSSYRPVFDRLLSVCEGDDRIRAMWLSGSLAKGTADGGSDLDVLLAIRDDDYDGFVADWREWLATITPVLLARKLPSGHGFYSLTTGCERVDVVHERVSDLPESIHRYRHVVFDRDGLDAAVPEPGPRPGPDLKRLRWIVEDFFRITAIAPFILDQRHDYLCVVQGVQDLQHMLYDVFVECNQPQPPMGVKQWSARLTPEQLRILTGLPIATLERDSVVTALRAVVTVMRTAGRAAVTGTGCDWPADLDDGVRRLLDQAL